VVIPFLSLLFIQQYTKRPNQHKIFFHSPCNFWNMMKCLYLHRIYLHAHKLEFLLYRYTLYCNSIFFSCMTWDILDLGCNPNETTRLTLNPTELPPAKTEAENGWQWSGVCSPSVWLVLDFEPEPRSEPSSVQAYLYYKISTQSQYR